MKEIGNLTKLLARASSIILKVMSTMGDGKTIWQMVSEFKLIDVVHGMKATGRMTCSTVEDVKNGQMESNTMVTSTWE